MYKLEFTLKQHTPLIHFQHDQEGATLRASEVKPKLDRFIKDYYKRKDKAADAIEVIDLINSIPDAKSIHQKKKPMVSPYKLKIEYTTKRVEPKIALGSQLSLPLEFKLKREGLQVWKRTPYFANNAELRNEEPFKAKLGLLTHSDDIKLTIQFTDQRWKSIFAVVVPAFFCLNNFGTRQSKGFGCFTLKETTQTEFENCLKEYALLAYKSREALETTEKAFIEIDRLWKRIKSGDQRNESELRRYFNKLRPAIEWEKPALQEVVQKASFSRIKINSISANRQFVRSVLGLANVYEFPKQDKIKATAVNIPINTKEYEEKVIERYPSPIIFKVFNNRIYFFINANYNPSYILNKEFSFSFSNNGRQFADDLSIYTPKNFDLEDFTKFVMQKILNWEKIQKARF